MARLPRSWHPVMRSYLDSSKLNRVSMQAEALYLRILVSADVQGVYHGDPFDVGSRLLTKRLRTGRATLEQVRALLDELGAAGLIRYFREGEEDYLVVEGYQTVNESRMPEFPAPPWSPSPKRGRPVPDTGEIADCIRTKRGASEQSRTEQEQQQTNAREDAASRSGPLEQMASGLAKIMKLDPITGPVLVMASLREPWNVALKVHQTPDAAAAAINGIFAESISDLDWARIAKPKAYLNAVIRDSVMPQLEAHQ